MLIGICDDDPNFITLIKEKTEKIIFPLDENYKIETFSKPQSLLVLKEELDLLLLDIDMPDIDGIALSKQCFSMHKKTIIIFISSHDEFIYDANGLNVFRFISKDHLERDFDQVLKECMDILFNQFSISLKTTKGEQIFFRYRDIDYFKIEDRIITIKTINHSYDLTQTSLLSLLEQLPSYFVLISRTHIVNIKNVTSLKKNQLSIHGENLNISRRKYQEVLEKYINFS